MRLGLMQPYFFPYLAHFSLIAAVDRWIVFDTSQYTKQSWMTRNRVLQPGGGWQYVSLPVANGSMSIRTKDVLLADVAATRARVLGRLSHYSRRAPYYAAVVRLVEKAFDSRDASLVELNLRGLRAVCRYLNLPFDMAVLSRMDLRLPEHLGAGEWALEICSALGADSYVNPVGGRALFDPAAFTERGIELRFAETAPFEYQPRDLPYEPGLSVLDVLMWVPPEQVLAGLRTTMRLVR